MIFVISGLSGSGKSTIANFVGRITCLPVIVPCTTRPMRPYEKNGVNYEFLTNKKFDSLDIVGKEEFKVANGETWKYGLLKSSIKDNCIVVLSPSGIKKLKDEYDEVFDIMISVDECKRMKRILERDDNQTKEEIARRQRDDLEIFEKYTPDAIVDNNQLISFTIAETVELINSYLLCN